MSNKSLAHENYEAIRDQLFDRFHKTGEELKNDLPNILRCAFQTKAWKHFKTVEGKPFKNLVEWLHHNFPNGPGMGQGRNVITYDEALLLTEKHSDVHRVLAKYAPNRGRGRPAKDNGLPTTHIDRHGTGRASVLSVRLAQEQPKFYNAWRCGKYKSVTAAATAAGILKGDANLRRAKSAYRKMSVEQRNEFLEWIKVAQLDKPARNQKLAVDN